MPSRRTYATDLSHEERELLKTLVSGPKPSVAPGRTEFTSCSTPSSTWLGMAAPEGCFPTTSRPGRPLTTTSEPSA